MVDIIDYSDSYNDYDQTQINIPPDQIPVDFSSTQLIDGVNPLFFQTDSQYSPQDDNHQGNFNNLTDESSEYLASLVRSLAKDSLLDNQDDNSLDDTIIHTRKAVSDSQNISAGAVDIVPDSSPAIIFDGDDVNGEGGSIRIAIPNASELLDSIGDNDLTVIRFSVNGEPQSFELTKTALADILADGIVSINIANSVFDDNGSVVIKEPTITIGNDDIGYQTSPLTDQDSSATSGDGREIIVDSPASMNLDNMIVNAGENFIKIRGIHVDGINYGSVGKIEVIVGGKTTLINPDTFSNGELDINLFALSAGSTYSGLHITCLIQMEILSVRLMIRAFQRPLVQALEGGQ